MVPDKTNAINRIPLRIAKIHLISRCHCLCNHPQTLQNTIQIDDQQALVLPGLHTGFGRCNTAREQADGGARGSWHRRLVAQVYPKNETLLCVGNALVISRRAKNSHKPRSKSQAKPSRAEPSQAEPSRAQHALQTRAVPSNARWATLRPHWTTPRQSRQTPATQAAPGSPRQTQRSPRQTRAAQADAGT